jgi:hypothetical protein
VTVWTLQSVSVPLDRSYRSSTRFEVFMVTESDELVSGDEACEYIVNFYLHS